MHGTAARYVMLRLEVRLSLFVLAVNLAEPRPPSFFFYSSWCACEKGDSRIGTTTPPRAKTARVPIMNS